MLPESLRNYPRPYLTDAELDILLNGTPDSRYGKVKRWLAQGKLLRIRRGLYCLTEYAAKPHPYELAQHIYGPSYISFESALSFYGLIPERVVTVTSATTKRSKEFQTPLGVFSYLHLPQDNFYTMVDLVKEENQQFFIAKPWKAICDYIFCYRKDWRSLDALLESLRINREELPALRDDDILLLQDYYQNFQLNRFLKRVINEY